MALITMIIPCYNLEKYIVECITSVENQTFEDFDIVVVDDGSTDKSVDSINKYINESKVKNIQLICKPNGGASSARNEGLRHATGKYVGFIDGDDFIDKDYLKNRVEAIVENDADLCVGGLRTYEDGHLGNDYILKRCYYDCKLDIEKNIDELNFMFIDPVGKLYKRDIIDINNIKFDERLKVAEDLAFALDFFSHVNRLQLIDDCSYNYRIRSDSLIHSVTLPTKQKYVWNHFVDYFSNVDIKCILEKNPIFCSYAWNFGLLNRIQANILDREDFKDIVITDLAKEIISTYKPVSRKDKVFHFCIKEEHYVFVTILVKLKYWLLTYLRPLYMKVKKGMR